MVDFLGNLSHLWACFPSEPGHRRGPSAVLTGQAAGPATASSRLLFSGQQQPAVQSGRPAPPLELSCEGCREALTVARV